MCRICELIDFMIFSEFGPMPNKNNFREIYSSNLSPAAYFNTEKYLKSRSSLAPIYIHNEARSKYEMISRVPLKKADLNSQVNILA